MADIDPPYRFDPLQNPVNVKWGEPVTPRLVWSLVLSGSNLPWPKDPQPPTPLATCSRQSVPRSDFSGLPPSVITVNDDNSITYSTQFGQTQFVWNPTPPGFTPTTPGILVIKYTSAWWIPSDGTDPISGHAHCEGFPSGVSVGSWHVGQAEYVSLEVFV